MDGRWSLFSMVKKTFTIGMTLLLLTALLPSCSTQKRVLPTGAPLCVENSFSCPGYDHSQILNVLVLPIQNSMLSENIAIKEKDFVLDLMRNFGKFGYFNLQFDQFYDETSEPVIDINRGEVDRSWLGAIGQEYNVQAVMQVSIDEYQAFAPMKMKVRAVMVDTNSGERVWGFDQVFDGDDADMMNLLRLWWNCRMAGGDERNNFEMATIRPSIFSNFVFYEMAESYGRARLENVGAVKEEEEYYEHAANQIERKQKRAFKR